MIVTVYFFKPSGKWYTTERYEWPDHERLFENVLPSERLRGMHAVCIDNPLGFPQMRPVYRGG